MSKNHRDSINNGYSERATSYLKLIELENRHTPVKTNYEYVEPLPYSVFSRAPVAQEPRWHCPVGTCSDYIKE